MTTTNPTHGRLTPRARVDHSAHTWHANTTAARTRCRQGRLNLAELHAFKASRKVGYVVVLDVPAFLRGTRSKPAPGYKGGLRLWTATEGTHNPRRNGYAMSALLEVAPMTWDSSCTCAAAYLGHSAHTDGCALDNSVKVWEAPAVESIRTDDEGRVIIGHARP